MKAITALSANTRRLAEICREEGAVAHQIETANDIEECWLEGHDTIGLTAGASTPDWIIEQVAARVNGGSLPPDWNLQHPD